MRFSRQEYWSGLPFPSPGDLSDPGIEPKSPSLQADALPSEPPGKPIQYCRFSLVIYFIHSSIYIYVYPNLPIPSPTCPLVSIHLFSMSLYFYLEPCPRALCQQPSDSLREDTLEFFVYPLLLLPGSAWCWIHGRCILLNEMITQPMK